MEALGPVAWIANGRDRCEVRLWILPLFRGETPTPLLPPWCPRAQPVTHAKVLSQTGSRSQTLYLQA
jgi:hypothetical protein